MGEMTPHYGQGDSNVWAKRRHSVEKYIATAIVAQMDHSIIDIYLESIHRKFSMGMRDSLISPKVNVTAKQHLHHYTFTLLHLQDACTTFISMLITL